MTILDRFSLTGQVALVTGGGRGLGFEMARALAEAGAHVIVTGRTATTLEDAVGTIRSSGGTAQAAAFDIVDREAQRALMADIEKIHDEDADAGAERAERDGRHVIGRLYSAETADIDDEIAAGKKARNKSCDKC